jgi:hypothetical protein
MSALMFNPKVLAYWPSMGRAAAGSVISSSDTSTDIEKKNKRLTASLMTQDWLTPPKLGVSEMQKKQFLGL